MRVWFDKWSPCSLLDRFTQHTTFICIYLFAYLFGYVFFEYICNISVHSDPILIRYNQESKTEASSAAGVLSVCTLFITTSQGKTATNGGFELFQMCGKRSEASKIP